MSGVRKVQLGFGLLAVLAFFSSVLLGSSRPETSNRIEYVAAGLAIISMVLLIYIRTRKRPK